MEEIIKKLSKNLEKEMKEFREKYNALSGKDVYKDYYTINFFEEYYGMLMSNFIDENSHEDVLKWLASLERPLAFLYEQWLSSDGAFNHDWDEMFDWIELIYQEEKENGKILSC